MFDAVRPQQVPIRGMGQAMGPGSGFMGPFGIYSDLGPPGGAPPPGFPRVSEEIQAPYGAETELHQYWCPDTGRYESLTIPEARSRECQAVAGGGGIAPVAKGAPPGLMGPDPRAFLGQVPFVGPGASPFYWQPPAGYFANPQGGPLMTEELTSPQEEHIAREFHCYQSPDGEFVAIPFGQADAYKAAGYVAVDYANCSTPAHAQPVGTPAYVMGQNGGGNGGGGGPPPVQGSPSPASPPQQSISFDREFRHNWWPGYFPNYAYPNYYYPPPPPPQQKLVCKRKEEDGEEVFECEPQAQPPQTYYPSYYPTIYPTFPVFRRFRPFVAF